MQQLIDRPAGARSGFHDESRNGAQDHAMSEAALWIIDALADELARDAGQDRAALVQALARRAGYEQADSLLPNTFEQDRAAWVARLAGRLARD